MQPQHSQQQGVTQITFFNVADLLYFSSVMALDRSGYDDTRTDPDREVIVTVMTGGEPYERAFVGEQADKVWSWFLVFTKMGRVQPV